jgi:general secretion pathway protein I
MRSMTPQRRRLMKGLSSGFTLLEVMMAVALMAIALTAVFGSQSQSLSMAIDAKFNTIAPFLAQSKMAEIEAEECENMASDSGDFEDDFAGYRWDMTVSDMTSGGPEGVSDHLKLVDLVVTWEDNTAYEYRLRFSRFCPQEE